MHKSLENLTLVKNKINQIINSKKLTIDPKIIIITKTFPLTKINPLLDSGHTHFGENKVQEAEDKWLNLKSTNKNLKLHMVGKLQTNKVNKAVKLFDYIHSLDNDKLAAKLSHQEKKLNKKIKFFIQINIGNENQKSGIELKDLDGFYNYCTREINLDVVGLMCIPPFNSNSTNYFRTLKNKADQLNLKELSMGMSSDYEEAVLNGSTYLRLGTAILGERNIN